MSNDESLPRDLRFLPRCLDMISAEEVIRRVELYFAGGSIDFLTEEQAAAAAEVTTGE